MEVGEVDIRAKIPIKQTCIVCEKTKKEGIYLYTSFVCRDCEKEIVQTDTSNVKYKHYLQQLKKILKPEIYN